MSFRSEMSKVFGVQRQTPVSGSLHQEPICDLTAIGYPGFTRATVFLTKDGRVRWETDRLLPFSNECCVCGVPAEAKLKARDSISNLLGFGRPTLLGIPHCCTHASSGHARLLARVLDQGRRYMSVDLVAANRRFLEDTLAFCSADGAYEPPWVVFPGKLPDIGWNQGTEGAWRRFAWEPFWRKLAERGRYIKEWHAPDEWEQYLANH